MIIGYRAPLRFFMCFSVLVLAAMGSASGVTYYVSTSGADTQDGLTPETAWATMARVNRADLKPGDAVLFKRGDVWRGFLQARSGDESAPLTYGAYGEGEKPLFLGSIAMNHPEDWVDEGNNIWSTRPPVPIGANQLPNPSFDGNTEGWSVYAEGGASATGVRDTSNAESAPAGFTVHAAASGKAEHHIQVSTRMPAIEETQFYLLTFKACASAPFPLLMPRLMQNQAPWENYAVDAAPAKQEVGTAWRTYTVYYRAKKTANDVRLTFFLGGCIPDGVDLHLDSLSFMPCDDHSSLSCDVGNIIFDNERSCGVKVWEPAQLDAQDRYWYDEVNHLVKIYSAECPATAHSAIELALRAHIIEENNTHYTVYENLALKYGAAHGIGGANTHHITVRACDVGYVGGGDQMGGDRTVRFGNGIEFWASAHDNLVEGCRLWEIYDAALTNQSSGPDTPHYNITYRNNIIWNSEYSFEYWNRPEVSETHHIYFENNTCVNAGFGWGHTQRPDPSGRHLCFYESPARLHDFFIRNNLFIEAKTNAFYAPAWQADMLRALTLDHNVWVQTAGDMININKKTYAMAAFTTYQTEWNLDPHSVTTPPVFVAPERYDYHLAPDSPGIDAGIVIPERKTDFDGVSVPQGNAPDIGALEFCISAR